MFKNHITTISPFQQYNDIPSEQKRSLKFPTLTNFDQGINNDADVVEMPNKFGAVPIYQDKLKFVEFGTKHINKDNNKSNVKDGDDSNNELIKENNNSKKINYKVSKYVEFSSYKLKNPVEKLFDVCILGFKILSKEVIEQILNVLINKGDDLQDESDYKWSYIEDAIDNKVIFLTLLKDDSNSIKRMKKLKEVSQKIYVWKVEELLITSFNSGLDNYLNDVLSSDEEDSNLKFNVEEIQEKINNLIKFSKESDKGSNTDDVSDYVIDESQLSDISVDVLPQLKKDIKDFRLKVVEIEKKKRYKEKQDEIKRSKAQLRKLFSSSNKDAMDIGDDDDDEEEEEDDGLTDEQFEEARIEKEKITVARNYTIKLVAIKAIERHNKELIELESKLKNYESSLDKTIKPEYEQGKFKPSGINREIEAERDSADRLKASEEGDVVMEEVSSVKVPLKVSIKQTEEEEEEEKVEERSDLDISDEQLEKALSQIKSKIESYLEDLLGVADEELTDYITMTIQDTKSKSLLVEELRETFDEDAEKITDLIWKDLLEAISS